MSDGDYLTLELANDESITFTASILKYITVLETLYHDGEERVEEDEDFRLEWPLWNLVKEILTEYNARFGTTIGVDRVVSLRKVELLKEVQLYDLYRLLRVMYHYDSPAMVDLLLQHIIERLLPMDIESLTLMNPRLGRKPEKGMAEDLVTSLDKLNQDYAVRRELLMLIFTYYIETYDLLQLIETHYLPEVTSVLACGKQHTAVITQDGLLVKGSNFYGQLGLSEQETPIDRWYDSPLTDVISVWSGAYHTMILKVDGLYACGNNEFGALGLESRLLVRRIFEPKKVNLPQVLSVGCGLHHTLFITVDGLFGTGRNTNGQLGTPAASRVYVPLRVDIEEPASAVACGEHYSLVLSETGNVYHSGLALQGIPVHTERFTRVILPLGTGKIEKIYAGSRHAIMINTRGEVYLWGANDDGQLGLGTKTSWQTSVIKHPTLKNITSAAACDRWSVFVNEKGELYTTGNNQVNEMGLLGGVVASTSVPVKVEIGNVISVACGGNFTKILTCDGLFTTSAGNALEKEEIVRVASKRPICKRQRLSALHCHMCGNGNRDTLFLNNRTQRILCSQQCQTQYREFRVKC